MPPADLNGCDLSVARVRSAAAEDPAKLIGASPQVGQDDTTAATGGGRRGGEGGSVGCGVRGHRLTLGLAPATPLAVSPV